MRRLNPDQLNVTYVDLNDSNTSILLRKYTLTHSDITGRLFLTIGKTYDHSKLRNWYTRFMRDEVLAEWKNCDGAPVLTVYCHISGGFVFGPASMRYRIFHQELPLVLESLCNGDNALFQIHPELEHERIEVRFLSDNPHYNTVENWGTCGDYRLITVQE